MSERRTGERYSLWIPVHFGQREPPEELAISYDISAGGIRISAARSLEVGAEVTIHFRMYPDDGIERKARGRIVRSERNRDDPLGLWPFRMAVAFEEPEPELEEAIRRTMALREEEG